MASSIHTFLSLLWSSSLPRKPFILQFLFDSQSPRRLRPWIFFFVFSFAHCRPGFCDVTVIIEILHQNVTNHFLSTIDHFFTQKIHARYLHSFLVGTVVNFPFHLDDLSQGTCWGIELPLYNFPCSFSESEHPYRCISTTSVYIATASFYLKCYGTLDLTFLSLIISSDNLSFRSLVILVPYTLSLPFKYINSSTPSISCSLKTILSYNFLH